MGYHSELDCELDHAWQQQQEQDERLEEDEMQAFIDSGRISNMELDDPHNEFGCTDFDAELGPQELAHIEALAEIQEYIHNGYGE